MLTRRMNGQTLEICDGAGQVVLSISEELQDGMLHMAVAGQLKNEAAHEFEDELMAAFSACPRLVLHFDQVDYIASMALRSLLNVQRMVDEAEDASMVLRGVGPQVMAVFKGSGFSEILQIETED